MRFVCGVDLESSGIKIAPELAAVLEVLAGQIRRVYEGQELQPNKGPVEFMGQILGEWRIHE